MQEYIEKANILVHALPYIKEFNGKIVVIKFGGSTMNNPKVTNTLIEDIALMKFVGMHPVVVHGGGPDINSFLNKIGKSFEFVNGLRVTDNETMEIVEMVLSGKISKQIVTALELKGVRAVGISGKDGSTLCASKRLHEGIDIGLVGQIEKVNTQLINNLINNDYIPIISSIGFDSEGNSYNINADYAAVAIAGALNAEKLVFLTDVSGILLNVDDPSSISPRIKESEIREMINNGAISGGMIPKVECCIDGVEAGVKNVHILDGRIEHSLILEIFTIDGIGTMIEKE